MRVSAELPLCSAWRWKAEGMADSAAPLSDDEMRQLMQLLRRHADTSMDQWERWRLTTDTAQLFIELRLTSQPGSAEVDYADMTGWSTGQ